MAIIENAEQFSNTYLLMLNKLWADETEIGRLRQDPRAYAVEAGLPVDAGSEVRVDESAMDDLYTTEQLTNDWNAQPGVHILHAPPAPTFDAAELSDVELDAVSAGGNNVIACYVACKEQF